jgi:hypothetical protein
MEIVAFEVRPSKAFFAPMLAAPSSREYWVWQWRWMKLGMERLLLGFFKDVKQKQQIQ